MTTLYTAAAADDPVAMAASPVPETFRAATVLAAEQRVFDGVPLAERDPRKTLHVQEIPTPEPGPNEVLVAAMASSVNYNTVWSSVFEPIPTFRFLRTWGRTLPVAARHDLPYHVVGSDLAGVVLRVGPGVTRWRPGDEVLAHCLVTNIEEPAGYDDGLLDPGQRTWGYETNYGGLADLSLVQGNQLMPKPAHLSWEEAASVNLVLSTAYRQLVSRHGADMRQGDRVLIWGACGGLGAFATQLVLNGGGMPICVVSSAAKKELCHRMGAQLVIDRTEFEFWDGQGRPRTGEWSRFRRAVRALAGADPDIVFEHPGRETFGVSVLTAARGGTVVTCASTSGYEHVYDNRHLWMQVKRIVGSHTANYHEAWASNDLVRQGRIHPVLSRTYDLADVADAVHTVHGNRHLGKVGVRCLAPREGLGIRDHALRAKLLDQITLFREHQASAATRP
jgi:crotonyl-CoA reductase